MQVHLLLLIVHVVLIDQLLLSMVSLSCILRAWHSCGRVGSLRRLRLRLFDVRCSWLWLTLLLSLVELVMLLICRGCVVGSDLLVLLLVPLCGLASLLLLQLLLLQVLLLLLV